MVTVSATIQNIRNTACIVCGAAFEVPRAGKLYCSCACKQFRHYHKREINDLAQPLKGISDERCEIKLKEYDSYSAIQKNLTEYKSLKKAKNSSFLTFDSDDNKKLKELESQLPEYVKDSRVGSLSLEEWSFVKLLYPKLRMSAFLKLVYNLGWQFFSRLTPDPHVKHGSLKNDPIKNLYTNHLLKIAEGKIKFI